MSDTIADFLAAFVMSAESLATLALCLAGFCMFFRSTRRRWAMRLLAFAVLLVAIHVYGPDWLP